MLSGEARITFLSPERFLLWRKNGFFTELASRGLDADLYVLDEMHCLEEWRGFRAGYQGLAEPLRSEIQRGASLLGLSASLALREAKVWMSELLGDENYSLVNAGLGRENLSLRVVALETEEERWLELVSCLRGLRAPYSALVYCSTRSEVDDVAQWLRSAGFEAVAYHAGLPPSVRAERSRAFRGGLLRVVCATSAFGMGIDYPRVARVIHFSMPRDLGSYWQEVGRAGRDGGDAVATAFWRRSEIARARRMGIQEREAFLSLWRNWAEAGCRKAAVATHLGWEEAPCGKCDRCLPESSCARTFSQAWWTEPHAHLREWVSLRRESGNESEVKERNFSAIAHDENK